MGTNFKFVIKAYQSLTHGKGENSQDFKTFTDALQPLLDAGKFGCVLAQFPQSMNNHYRGQSVVNAGMIRDMLRLIGASVL